MGKGGRKRSKSLRSLLIVMHVRKCITIKSAQLVSLETIYNKFNSRPSVVIICETNQLSGCATELFFFGLFFTRYDICHDDRGVTDNDVIVESFSCL